jgi:pyruvate kinase
VKKTKIVATFGPSTADQSILHRLVESGVNLFRINCSHGEERDFIRAARLIRRATRGLPYRIPILLDLSGPKLRLARFDGELALVRGDELVLTQDETDLARRRIGVNHPTVIRSVRSGQRVFVDDGTLLFTAVKTGSKRLTLRAEGDGTLLSGKGINLPDSRLDIPSITTKDRRDLKTAVALKADFVALSFVRCGDDIVEIRRLIKRLGGTQRVIAKLEKREAIEDLENIMQLSDGVMVARGDLGVELPPEDLPPLQKKISRMAHYSHKAVIVATQMLESMRFAPRATRAEVNDVASAVYDYVDAVMLSAETASGKYPLEAVRTMARVIEAAEKNAPRPKVEFEELWIKSDIPLAIARAVTDLRRSPEARAICAFTTSGFTAELIANMLPREPVIALTPDRQVCRHLMLRRSVYPKLTRQPKSFRDMLGAVEKVCRETGLAGAGDRVIITGGVPFGASQLTNMLVIHEIGGRRTAS